MRKIYECVVGKPEIIRKIGRPRRRSEDNNKMVLTRI
jgi:hypothetical protein